MASQGLKFHTKAQMKSRLLNTGHRVVSKQVSSTLIPEQRETPVSMSSKFVSMRRQRSLALVSLIHT